MAAKENIVDLTKIAPRKTYCQTSIGKIEIRKIGVGDIAAIMLKYPQIGALFRDAKKSIGLNTIAGSVPEAIPEIIAYGTPAKLDSLPGILELDAGDQIKLFAEVFNNSFPGGITGFFQVATEAMGMLQKNAVKGTPLEGLTEEQILQGLKDA